MIVKCPTCSMAVVWEETPTRPFCSYRCKLIDLGRWLDEEYTIPSEEFEEEGPKDEEQSSED